METDSEEELGGSWKSQTIIFLKNPLMELIHQDKNDVNFQRCRTHSWRWI